MFETEVHNTIVEAKLFKPGDRVAIGASGGKGALPAVLVYTMCDETSMGRLDRVGSCHEDAQRPVQLRPGAVPSFH